MNPFADFGYETVTLIKQTGHKINDIKAQIQAKKIFVDDVSIQFDEGDIISRELPNGKIEYYRVIDPVYYDGIVGIPPHYQINVEKTTTPPRSQPIYINASNGTKVLIDSTDNSININYNDKSIFDELIEKVKTLPDADAIVSKINQMKESVNDKDTYRNKYSEFIQLTAAHITIVAPFIPLLTKFLS